MAKESLKLEDDVRKAYEKLLDLQPIPATAEQLRLHPYKLEAMPEIPECVLALHRRAELYFRRLYNRGLERGHLPMIAATAMEIEERERARMPRAGIPPLKKAG